MRIPLLHVNPDEVDCQVQGALDVPFHLWLADVSPDGPAVNHLGKLDNFQSCVTDSKNL
jgi:hypothetical protein